MCSRTCLCTHVRVQIFLRSSQPDVHLMERNGLCPASAYHVSLREMISVLIIFMNNIKHGLCQVAGLISGQLAYPTLS